MKRARPLLMLASTVALAGCGRIGYERLTPTRNAPEDAGQDAAEDAGDEDTGHEHAHDGAPDDLSALDLAPRDLPPRDFAEAETPVMSGCPACPPGVNVSDWVAGPIRGSPGPIGAVALCPRGAVVIGFQSARDGMASEPTYGAVAAICGMVTVSGSLVSVGQTSVLIRAGASAVTSATVCPAHHVVVALDGTSPDRLDRLDLVCSALELSAPTTSGPRTLRPAGPLAIRELPGPTGGTPSPRAHCPPGQVGGGVQLPPGPRIDYVGLICGTAYYVAP